MFSDAWHVAVNLGHDLELGWHDTEPATWVAQCYECLGFLAVDFTQDRRGSTEYKLSLYGSVADEACEGPPPDRFPAVRRDPFQEAAVSDRGLEPLPTDAAMPPDWFSWQRDPEQTEWMRRKGRSA